jgi:hypothetical protein
MIQINGYTIVSETYEKYLILSEKKVTDLGINY